MTRGRGAAASAALACALAATACFSPQPASGLPCTADERCPGDLVCDTSQQPAVCVESPGTAVDAPPLTTVDAAPPIDCDDGSPCPDEVPVCDDGTCRGCIADAECDSGACLELEGVCPPEDAILYVAPFSSGTACTKTAPCTIATAAQTAAADRNVIRLAAGTYPSVTVTFGAGITVYLSGPDRSWETVTLHPGMSSLRVRNNARVIMEGFSVEESPFDAINVINATVIGERLRLYLSEQAGIDATDATLELRDLVVEDAATHGIVATNSTVAVDRSYLVENGASGLYVEGGTVVLTNSILGGNGAMGDDLPALDLEDVDAASLIAYVTFVDNGVFSVAGAIDCFSSAATITSSIFALNSGVQVDDSCEVSDSLFTGFSAPPGNIVGDPQFIDPDGFDFHIAPTSPAKGLGAPVAGVTFDLDGEPRPQGDALDAGADEIP